MRGEFQLHPSYLILKLIKVQIMKLRNIKKDQKLKNILRYLKIFLIIIINLKDMIEPLIFFGLEIKLVMEERVLKKNGIL